MRRAGSRAARAPFVGHKRATCEMTVGRYRMLRTAALTAVVVAAVAGCGSAGVAAPVTQTVTVTAPAATSAATPPAPHVVPNVSLPMTTYIGTAFSIDYPNSWQVDAMEVSQGTYTDTTIRSPSNAELMLRVDVSAGTGSVDPASDAAPVVAGLRSQSGYREIAYVNGNLAGYPSLRWEFLVSEAGALLHKIDTFFVTPAGDSYAVLVQAPATAYARWRTLYNQIRNSITVDVATSARAPAVSPPPVTIAPVTPADFCSTHSCIANFDNGNGYIVQCVDGMWSQSGGIQGACSGHGGESSNTDTAGGSGSYAPPLPSRGGQDLGPGNGYQVTCMDGSVSHSGGISGACSHHGGVGP
jgi:hypothetical protein